MDKRTDVEMLPPPPSVIVIDVGQSSTEFMEAVRSALPPERRSDVVATATGNLVTSSVHDVDALAIPERLSTLGIGQSLVRSADPAYGSGPLTARQRRRLEREMRKHIKFGHLPGRLSAIRLRLDVDGVSLRLYPHQVEGLKMLLARPDLAFST